MFNEIKTIGGGQKESHRWDHLTKNLVNLDPDGSKKTHFDSQTIDDVTNSVQAVNRLVEEDLEDLEDVDEENELEEEEEEEEESESEIGEERVPTPKTKEGDEDLVSFGSKKLMRFVK